MRGSSPLPHSNKDALKRSCLFSRASLDILNICTIHMKINSIILYSVLNVQLLHIEHICKFPKISLHTFIHSNTLPGPPQNQYTTLQSSCIIFSSPSILGCCTSPLAQCYCSSTALLQSPQGTPASHAL